jgi:ABC-type multidrug transport system ATPase subunit
MGQQERTGSMLAILGPSGAGKTTLLDTLAGRRGGEGVRGEIRVNGRLASPARVQAISG